VHNRKHRRNKGDAMGASAPPGRRKKLGVIYRGKFVSAPPGTPSAPPGRARVNF